MADPDRRYILRAIFALSLPSIVTNITTPLLSITDVAIAGHMGNAVFIAAIAVGGTMFNMLYWLFGFLRMGSSGLTAQAYGAGDCRGRSLVLYRAMAVAVIVGVGFIALRAPLCRLLLEMMDPDVSTAAYVRSYFMICVWGAPAVLGTFVLTGWFLGMQNSRAPMWVSVFMDLFNIATSLVLVYGAGMQLTGIALGTLSAQWGGFLLGIALCLRRYDLTPTSLRDIMNWSELKKFFSVNIDIFLRTVCLVAVTMWFTRVGALQGSLMLAVNALLMQLFTIFSFFMDGFAFAGEALCGRFQGARDHKSLRLTSRLLVAVGSVLALAFTTLYFIGGEGFLSLLSDDHDVVSRALEFRYWAVCIPVVGFLAFTWDGVFIGLTATRFMLLSMASATAVYFLVYWLLFPEFGNHGLWIAFLSYLFTRGIVLTLAAPHKLRQPPQK